MSAVSTEHNSLQQEKPWTPRRVSDTPSFRSPLFKRSVKSPTTPTSPPLTLTLSSPIFKKPSASLNSTFTSPLSPGPPHLESTTSPPTPPATAGGDDNNSLPEDRRESLISNQTLTDQEHLQSATDKEETPGNEFNGLGLLDGLGGSKRRGGGLGSVPGTRSRDTSVDQWDRPSIPPSSPRTSGIGVEQWEPPTPPPSDFLKRKRESGSQYPKRVDLLSFSSLLSHTVSEEETPPSSRPPLHHSIHPSTSPIRNRSTNLNKSTWDGEPPTTLNSHPENPSEDEHSEVQNHPQFPSVQPVSIARLQQPPSFPLALPRKPRPSTEEIESARPSYSTTILEDEGTTPNHHLHLPPPPFSSSFAYPTRSSMGPPPTQQQPPVSFGASGRRSSAQSSDSSTASEREGSRRPLESTADVHGYSSEIEHHTSHADLDTQTTDGGGGDPRRRRRRAQDDRKSETWGDESNMQADSSFRRAGYPDVPLAQDPLESQISSSDLKNLYASSAAGWKTALDQESGRWYWYNKTTGERTWEDPLGGDGGGVVSDQGPSMHQMSMNMAMSGVPDQDAVPLIADEKRFLEFPASHAIPRDDDEMSVAESIPSLTSRQLKVHVDPNSISREESRFQEEEEEDDAFTAEIPKRYETRVALDSGGGIKLRLTPVSRLRRDSDLSSVESRAESQMSQKRGRPLFREVPMTALTRRKLGGSEPQTPRSGDIPSPHTIPNRDDEPVRLRFPTPTPSIHSERYGPGPGFRGKIVDRTPLKVHMPNDENDPELSQNQQQREESQLDPYPKKPAQLNSSKPEVDIHKLKLEEEKQAQLQKKKNRGLHDSQVRRVLKDIEAREIELDEETPDFRFSTHRMGNWFQRITRTGDIRDEKRVLSWQNTPIYKSLLKKNRPLDKKSAACFKRIMGYMGDRKTTKLPLVLAQKLLGKLLTGKPELREEAYLQLCKQVTENPNPSSCIKGWELMIFFLATFPPGSIFLEKFVTDFITNTTHVCTDQTILKLANMCEQRINTIVTLGARKQVPSAEELTKLQACAPCSISVFLLNGDEVKLNVDSYTAVSDVEEMMVQTRKIVMSPSPFALYESVTDTYGVDRILVGKDRVLDVLAAWEHRESTINKKLAAAASVPTRPSPSHSGSSSVPSSSSFSKIKQKLPKFDRLLYKAKVIEKVQDSKELISDPEALELFFVQACYEISHGRYKCKDEDITTLAALQVHATYGPSRDNPSFSDPRVIGPVVQQFVGPTFLRVPDLEGKTFRKYERLDDMENKEVDGEGGVGEEKVPKVHLSAMDAKINYLDFVNRYPLFGANFFMAEQFQWRDYPSPLIIAVWADGLALLDPSKKVLESYGYDELSTWGCSEEKFIIVVGNVVDQRKLVFYTPYGWEIDDLLTSYVNFKLKDQAGKKLSSRPMTPQSQQSRSRITPTPILEK